MMSKPRQLAAWLVTLLAGCAAPSWGTHVAQVAPSPADGAPAPSTPPATAAPAAQASEKGPPIAFKFDPPDGVAWGLRVARHRTLPSPRGDQEPLHFDSEENSRIWAERKNGDWVLNETLTSYSNTKNGDTDDDDVLKALQGVTVGIELTSDGRWVSAVNPGEVLRELRQSANSKAGHEADEATEFARELERDWRLGAEIYLTQPVYQGVPVYSLESVSLPQLPSQYVVVAETFAAPSTQDGRTVAKGEESFFGRSDPRWVPAMTQLEPLLHQLGVAEDEVLQEFSGTGSETVDIHTLEVLTSGYSGEGIYPLVTQHGRFPLRFMIEEVAGSVAAPPIPPRTPSLRDPNHSAGLRHVRPHVRAQLARL